MNKKISKIKIGQIGVIEIKLPVITIGSGEPKGVIVAGLHGKEISSVLIIKSLLNKISNLSGQLIIIPTANPIGQIINIRNEPIDEMDLNRIFPGSNRKNFSQRIAANIFSILADADFVIDIHNFTRLAPFTGILIKNNDKKVFEAQKKMLKSLKPEIIWEIDCEKDASQQGSLDMECVKQGIPAISIEMPRLEYLNNDQVEKISDGIMNITNIFNMTNKDIDKKEEIIPIYEFKMIYSDNAGLFIPEVLPLEEINKGQKIGTVTSLTDYSEKEILSEKSGVITTIQAKGLIRTGTKLYTIGKRMGKI